MSYLGNQIVVGSTLQLPLIISHGGTNASTIIGAKTTLGVISSQNDGTFIESGTTAQRGPATTYKIRFNVDTSKYEGSTGSQWSPIAGGARNDVFFVNSNRLVINTTINSGENAVTAGPINIDNGVTILMDNNSTWTIVGG